MPQNSKAKLTTQKVASQHGRSTIKNEQIVNIFGRNKREINNGIADKGFEAYFDYLYSEVKKQGLPFEREELYSAYSEIADGKEHMPIENQFDKFKEKLSSFGKGAAAVAAVVIILASSIKFVNWTNDNMSKSIQGYEARIVEQQKSEVDRIFDLYGKNFSKKFIEKIYFDLDSQGNSPEETAQSTEEYLTKQITAKEERAQIDGMYDSASTNAEDVRGK